MPHSPKPEANEVQTAQAVDPAAICSALSPSPKTHSLAEFLFGQNSITEVRREQAMRNKQRPKKPNAKDQ